jgi:transposase
VKTLVPVLQGFKERHHLDEITVTADAAMLSAGNIEILERLKYHYIIGSRLTKTPYAIEARMTQDGLCMTDGQIIDSIKEIAVNGKKTQRREIFQYREKRAALDLSNIEKTLAKAQKIVEGKAGVKRNRFLTIKGAQREINLAIVEKSRHLAGIKGYVTDLDIPAQQVIDAYHQLFQVEKSFRMSKSDLKARPIYHHNRSAIEAHLTIVFTALAISRRIERTTGISIKKFVTLLQPIRTGLVSINGKPTEVEPLVPPSIDALLRLLSDLCMH